MKNAPAIVLGSGLVLMIGFVTATMSHAQRPVTKSDTPAGRSAELGERIVKLRSDIDVLQVSYDGLRPALVDALREMNNAEIKGDILSTPWMITMELEATSGDPDSIKSVTDFAALRTAAKSEDDADKIYIRLRELTQRRKKKYLDRLSGLKDELARLARELNEKKLNLAVAESNYQREIR